MIPRLPTRAATAENEYKREYTEEEEEVEEEEEYERPGS